MKINENVSSQAADSLTGNAIIEQQSSEKNAKRQEIQLERITVDLNDINFNHPLLKNIEIQEDSFYIKEFKELHSIYNSPFLVKYEYNYLVVGNGHEVLAAKKSGIRKLEGILITGFDEDDIPRLITHRNFFITKGFDSLYQMIVYMEKHLSINPRGQKWAKEIPGDMKRKLASIFGVSETKIQNIKQIGDFYPIFLKDIDNEKKTLNEVIARLRYYKKDLEFVAQKSSPDAIKYNGVAKKVKSTIPDLPNQTEEINPEGEIIQEKTVEIINEEEEGGDENKEYRENQGSKGTPIMSGGMMSIKIETEEWGWLEIKKVADSTDEFTLTSAGGFESTKLTTKKINKPRGGLAYIFKEPTSGDILEIGFKNLGGFCKWKGSSLTPAEKRKYLKKYND